MPLYQNRLFTVYIDEIQREIAKIRLAASKACLEDETIVARNVYKGWFSQTAKIFKQLEKADIEMTIFEVIRFRAIIERHLQKIANEKSVMHQNKREALIYVLKLLENISQEKHARLMQSVNELDPILGNNKDYIQHVNDIKRLYSSNQSTIGYLNRIKLAVEALVQFLKGYRESTPHQDHVPIVNRAIVNMLKVSEEKLRQDCLDMITSIKLMVNKNADLASFAVRHKRLLNLSAQDRSNSHVMFQLITLFINDLEQWKKNPNINNKLLKIYNYPYKKLNKRYKTLLKNNAFYLNEKELNQTSEDTIELLEEVNGAQAPLRPSNRITHYLNAYDNIAAPSESLTGAYPEMMNSIMQAEKLICIAGWEINLHLNYYHPEYTQAQHETSNNTLGRMLVRKAIANPNLVIAIKVWAQFWDGSMKHHHDSIAYLDKIAREEGFIHGIADLPNLQFRAVNHSGLFNSHHAKVLMTDEECIGKEGTQERKLTAFYGGLDLAMDRMDDSNHTKHRNANIYGWRDVHQQIRGPPLLMF